MHILRKLKPGSSPLNSQYHQQTKLLNQKLLRRAVKLLDLQSLQKLLRRAVKLLDLQSLRNNINIYPGKYPGKYIIGKYIQYKYISRFLVQVIPAPKEKDDKEKPQRISGGRAFTSEDCIKILEEKAAKKQKEMEEKHKKKEERERKRKAREEEKGKSKKQRKKTILRMQRMICVYVQCARCPMTLMKEK